MTREDQRARYKRIIDDLDNSSDECLRAISDLKVMELEDICIELKNALADANDTDSAAEGYNSANFAEKRDSFYKLIKRAEEILK